MAQEKIGWGYASQQFGPQLFVRYRLTLEEYKRLWNLQDGRCAGCLEEFAHPLLKAMKTGLKPEVDHDHAGGGLHTNTVVVRGLLCRKCNDFLGKIKDNQEQLLRLQEYLKNPPRSQI